MSATARTKRSGAASLTSLKHRGLGGVQLVISDQHAGLVKALRRCFQGAGHQRCRVHFARNLLAHVPKSHMDMVAAMFRTIFAQPEAAAVRKAWDQIRDQLAKSFPKIGPLMDDEWQAGDRRYLSDQSMDLLYPERNNQPIAAIGSGE